MVLTMVGLTPSLALAEGALAPTEAGNESTAKLIANAGDNDHRMAYQADSLTGVLMLAVVVLAAAWLNHASPSRRVVGTFLTAPMTLGIGLMIGWLHLLGSLDSVRPPFLPTDDLKPNLMRGLGVVFTVGGFFLLLYILMIGFPITGFAMSTFGGKYSHFFFWDTPLFWVPDADLIVPRALLHKLALPILFYVVFAAHIAGALKHQFVDKHDDAFRRMVT
ncbi:cytochrome b/b6 domain-containing protein [Parvibaculaceae bacterium PLY_AMNH_Bact1]|nr:cytochrome b/b6 domain-containing protein [Parvibaculaceae bacterium PLY_AMNH_Bact1]